VDEARVFRRTISSSKDEVASVSAELGEFCERWEAPFKQQYSVMMAVEELGVAIIQHGFEDRSDGYIQITVIALENGDFELHLRDDAKSFDPFSLNTQRASSLQDADMDTIGVYMIKERSKDFVYRKYQGFNTLIVRI
jgi:anti-sigma regulatory factor (Ser/Thr protein kinase)